MIKNLIFIFYPPLSTGKNMLYKALAEQFYNDCEYNILAITTGKESREFLKSVNVKWHKTYDYVEYNRSCDYYNYEKFNDLSEKYNLLDLNEVFEHAKGAIDKQYCGIMYTDEEKNQMLYSILTFWIKVLSENENSIFIDEGVASLFSPLYELFPNFKSVVFNLLSAPTDGKFIITHQGYQEFKKMDKAYNTSISDDELDSASKFIRAFRKNKNKPVWYFTENNIKTKFYSLKKIINKFKTLIKVIKSDKSVFNDSINKRLYESLAIFKPKIHYNLTKWDEFQVNHKYFVYPLHVEPEATINLIGAHYSNQLNLIKQISLSLPIDTFLYVKEHPAAIGKRGNIKFYKQIKKIKNARLIDPLVDPHEVINNSLGIITISSTMGFEGILYKKPVIVFGKCFYRMYNFCYKVTDLDNLSELIRKCIDVKNLITDRDVEKFIASYSRELYDGYMNYNRGGKTETLENVIKIKSGIIEEIRYIEKGK